MESESQSETADAQCLDTVFTILRNRRRRCLLSCLSNRESPASLTDLAAEIAAREREAEADEVPEERIDAVAAALHHTHLPKLIDADVLAYDAEAKTVTPTRVGKLRPFLSAIDGNGE